MASFRQPHIPAPLPPKPLGPKTVGDTLKEHDQVIAFLTNELEELRERVAVLEMQPGCARQDRGEGPNHA